MKGFFSFWLQKWRMTMLLVLLLIVGGVGAMIAIPKESSPTIEFGIISVVTSYPGASPEDMDDLVTTEIEKAIEGIDGIDKVESTSKLGLSSVKITLTTDADTTLTLNKIKDEIDTITLPLDANDPLVMEVSIQTDTIFSLVVYTPSTRYTQEELMERVTHLQKDLESQSFISSADASPSLGYDIDIILNKSKTDILGLSPASVASVTQVATSSTPLGNYDLQDTSYDYSIEKLVDTESDLGSLSILTAQGMVLLDDIAKIQRSYDNTSTTSLIRHQQPGNHFVTLTINKSSNLNIFESSSQSKKYIEAIMESEYSDLDYLYAQDIAEIIGDDYSNVTINGLTTLVLVFVAVFIFVGWKESLIATISIPLAFFVTFMVLNALDYSLNFLTNFSLIVTFGIAIDTIIVIIEAATEKYKLGFDPYHAALLAVEEFKRPLIAGTTTTCVVFVPLFVLPGITGKFLAYIPITIFITLVAALALSLVANPVFYYLFTPRAKTYERHMSEEEVMDDDIRKLLDKEREGKSEIQEGTDRRHRVFGKLGSRYKGWMESFLSTPLGRKGLVFFPIGVLVLSFVALAGSIGFELFPAMENPFMTFRIESAPGSTSERFDPYLDDVNEILASVPEIKLAHYTVDNNLWSINIELYKEDERDAYGGRSAYEIEDEINQNLGFLREQGWKVESIVQSGGPPTGKAVGVKLVADSKEYFDDLKAVARDFEQYLGTLEHTKNVTNSAETTPGLFSFQFDKASLQVLGLSPGQVTQALYASLYGVGGGSLPGIIDDHDISVVYDEYQGAVTPQKVGDVVIQTPRGSVAVRDILSYDLVESIASYQRENGNLIIKIESDLEAGIPSSEVQTQFVRFAETYNYPEGVSYSAGGEFQENADLVSALGMGAVIAFLLIYAILVLQFNSYRQPAFIMYSIVVSLIGVNIGLWITGNTYSMPAFVGFIALMGIVVNDAIVLIDRINFNLARGMDKQKAILEAGASRLQPILLTTITTIVGLTSVATQDEFFAGLAYTIMFGLFVGSAMTLFVVPSMYLMWARE